MNLRALVILAFLSSTKAYSVSDEECLDYTIYPVQYELTLHPYIYDDRSFSYDCEMTITFIVNSGSVTVIEMDAMDIEIDSSSVQLYEGDGRDNLIDSSRPLQFDRVKEKVYIYLRYPLKEYRLDKTQYYLKMKFRKYLRYDSTGVFIVNYNDGKPNYVLTTQLSPNKAKYFLPCFDNPQFEAVFKFKVYLRPPPDGMTAFNTTLVIAKEQKVTKFKDGVVLIEYIPSPQVALRQLGFHLSPYKDGTVIAKNTNDTLIIWAAEPSLPDYMYILNFGKSIINLIHDYASVNRPLVYGPINIVAVPKELHGYEIDSWNLLVNSVTKLEYTGQTSIRQVEVMKFDLTQQLCRIWLGNPGEIERTRWKEEWFKEGMATYLAHYFLAQFNQGTEATNQRWPLDYLGIDMKNKAMFIDWEHNTSALLTFNRTLAVDIPSRYKELVMFKTASILWMVENWLGSDKFHKALVKYINTRRGKFISLEDFITHLDMNTVECSYQFFNGSTASKVLKSWFGRPGYPVINVKVLRDRPLDAVILKQRQFSFNQNNRDETDYLIPISYIVQNNDNCYNCHRPRFTIGMQSYTFEENLNGGWIILNRNASGYYRVNYDKETWLLIAKALKENPSSIDQLNRAQIVNDVFALYAAGDIDYYLAMDILDYLDLETSYAVWISAISGFELLKIEGAACKLSRAVYEQWQDFMSKKVSTIYQRLMSVIKVGGSRLFRSQIVEFACSVKHQQCIDNLKSIYHSKKRINPDYRVACYYILLKDNSNAEIETHNDFEIEELGLAERKMRKEERFLHKIPFGTPMPQRIQEPKLPENPAPPIAANYTAKPDDGSSAVAKKISISTTVMAAFFATGFYRLI